MPFSSHNYNLDKIQSSGKYRHLPIILTALILILAILLSIFAISMVITRADRLMRLSSKPFNKLAENIMPKHENITFSNLELSSKLSAWYFPARAEKVRGNIIFIHNNRSNRLQFDMDSVGLFTSLQDSGFNLLAFDLRHSGQSEGQVCSYGLSEYQDVLAAMRQMEVLSGRKEFILFGFGSGMTAALYAWNSLPDRELSKAERPSFLKDISFSKNSIKAIILDSPAASTDDFIRADLSDSGLLNKYLYHAYIPLAVRLSSGNPDAVNLVPLSCQIQAPMMFIYHRPDTEIPVESIDILINERLRLNPETTELYEVPKSGHIEAYLQEPKDYLKKLMDFLDHWVEK